jgi:hypothetical protein
MCFSNGITKITEHVHGGVESDCYAIYFTGRRGFCPVLSVPALPYFCPTDIWSCIPWVMRPELAAASSSSSQFKNVHSLTPSLPGIVL